MNQNIDRIKEKMKIKNPVIIEIGCCEGEDSLEFLHKFGDETRVYCFEADPRNIKIFNSKVGFHPRCTLIPMAISDHDGETTFYQSLGKRPGHPSQIDRCSSGSINKPDGHLQAQKWCSFSNGIQVPATTLDTWCKNNDIDRIDLVWADVNGGEKAMINGAKEAFSFTKYLYTEFGPTKKEAEEWFGFEVDSDFRLFEHGITRDDILSLLPDFEFIGIMENNVFMRNTKIT